jgi:hypothetical protein
MPIAEHITSSTAYASSDDFCRIFNEEAGELYLLSFLLTANRDKAEQCFISGLDNSVSGTPCWGTLMGSADDHPMRRPRHQP